MAKVQGTGAGRTLLLMEHFGRGFDHKAFPSVAVPLQTIKEETDGLHEELEFIRLLGTDLIFACGETEKPEVKKSIDEVGRASPPDKTRWEQVGALLVEPDEFCVAQMNNAWENLNKTWKERLEKLEEAMQSAVQYQDTLQVRGRAAAVEWVGLGSSTEPSPWSCAGICTSIKQEASPG